MDNNSWRPAHGGGGEPTMDAGDWRSQSQPDSRQRIVNKMVPPPHIQSEQQSQSQITQVHPMHENHMNLQLQSMNLQVSSEATMQQNSVATLQHNSLSSLSGVPTTSQSMISTLQPGSTIDSGQASLDSTAQRGNANSGDWQEEIYQKIKVMKEAYLPKLTEMYHKIVDKLQQFKFLPLVQHDSLPQQPKNEQLEKLRIFKTMLERILQFLQVPKSNILPNFNEKLPAYEKHIVNFLNSNRPRKPGLSLQQGQQIPPPHIQFMPQSQQSQSQITQVHPMHENQMYPHLRSMNLQGSVASMQQNNGATLQRNSLSFLSGVPTTPQSLISTLQPGSTIDSGQGSELNALQQVAVGSVQQNLVNAQQQANINSLSSHSGMNVLQPNLAPVQSNSNMLS
ncbi:hypothetical protein RHMOL_Rhmol01G0064700 [Rhododendron molle]|uniref:Uncharacterized protein n=2 Tax=Rhododendron molle TaxID=49168 RepID=A0ACC0Q057_RHOML|nr:hypothetical protein RHMOL_Rhmol01G0064700 [Rhododendron molle]KAI8570797.1 hypothetical protein RHMOL_Rhmol01G0064700 [Rhododendron molle]